MREIAGSQSYSDLLGVDPAQDLVTTKGDLVAASGADALSRLGIGADATVLTARAAETLGMIFAVDPVQDLVTTKGDIVAATGSKTLARKALGSEGRVMISRSAQATGIAWEVDPVQNMVTTKGDLVAATAGDALARLAVGADNQVLTADSGEATGMKWGALPAVGAFYSSIYPHVEVLTSGTINTFGSYVEVSSNIGSTKHLYLAQISLPNNGGAQTVEVEIAEGGAGSESVVARFSQVMGHWTAVGWPPENIFNIGVNLTDSARITVRIRRNVGGATTGYFVMQVGAQ